MTAAAPLGDLTQFRTITQDTLTLLRNKDQAGATSRIDDLEYAWDQAQARLKPLNQSAWSRVDGNIDIVLRDLRATRPDAGQETAALRGLLAVTS